jgi:excisionase family DNA binding protein
MEAKMTLSKLTRTQDSSDDEQLLGLDTAAKFLGLSVWTLRKWAHVGRIKSAKLGSRRLIPMSEVRRLIKMAKGEEGN